MIGAKMTILERAVLDLKPFINAAGPVTMYCGASMPQEVIDADVTIFNPNALVAKSQEVFISTPVEATHRDMIEFLTMDTLRIAGANLNIAPYPV